MESEPLIARAPQDIGFFHGRPRWVAGNWSNSLGGYSAAYCTLVAHPRRHRTHYGQGAKLIVRGASSIAGLGAVPSAPAEFLTRHPLQGAVWYRHSAGRPVEQALLAEVIALRTIVANLIYAFTKEGKVTREQMLAFVDRADKTKVRRATEFLSQILRNGQPEISVEPPQGPE